jgi:hypothetical protein
LVIEFPPPMDEFENEILPPTHDFNAETVKLASKSWLNTRNGKKRNIKYINKRIGYTK